MGRQIDAQVTGWMNRHPAPCKRYRDKRVGCHTECGRYNTWRDSREKAKEEFMASPDAAIARRDEDMIRTTKVRHIKK